MVLYEDLEKVCFYTADEQWLEIKVKETALPRLPCNMLSDGSIYIKVNTTIVNDKYKAWKQLKESGSVLPEGLKIERSFDPCPYMIDNDTLKNYEINTKYNKAFSCDFLSFEFVEPAFRELLEYHTIGEFNQVRGKDFIGFSSFH